MGKDLVLIRMDQKTKKTLVFIVLIVIIVAVSGRLGDYTALFMSTSTTVKNGMLVQLIFLLGLITGSLLCLAAQKLERWSSLPDKNEPPKKGQIP
jgi:cadmium resistance protein CadD (predicted permease)